MGKEFIFLDLEFVRDITHGNQELLSYQQMLGCRIMMGLGHFRMKQGVFRLDLEYMSFALAILKDLAHF